MPQHIANAKIAITKPRANFPCMGIKPKTSCTLQVHCSFYRTIWFLLTYRYRVGILRKLHKNTEARQMITMAYSMGVIGRMNHASFR